MSRLIYLLNLCICLKSLVVRNIEKKTKKHPKSNMFFTSTSKTVRWDRVREDKGQHLELAWAALTTGRSGTHLAVSEMKKCTVEF